MRFSPPPTSGREAGGLIGATGSTRAPAKRSLHHCRSAANAIPLSRMPRGLTSLIDIPANEDRADGGCPHGPLAAAMKPGDIELRQILIRGQSLQVAIRHGAVIQPPLLLFNGIC